MNRRQLLAAAPAIGAASFVGLASGKGFDTPVRRAYLEWKAAADDLADPSWDEADRADQDAACARMSRLQDLILDMEAVGPEDFIMKVIAATYFGEIGLPDHHERPDLWAEARGMIAA